VAEFEEGHRIAWQPAESGQRPPGHLWRRELGPAGASRTRVTCACDRTRLADEKRFPQARAITAGKLRASLDRLAALAEGAWPPAAHAAASAAVRPARCPGRPRQLRGGSTQAVQPGVLVVMAYRCARISAS
jgi:hypothetical protein